MKMKKVLSGFEYLIYFFSVTVIIQALSSFVNGILANDTYNGDAVLEESKWMIYIVSHIVILTLFFYIRNKSKDGREIIKFARLSLQEVVPIVIVGIAEVVFWGYLLTFFEGNTVDTYHAKSEALIQGNVVLRFMVQVILAPIVEEMVFRGCMLERFRKIMPTALAIILSSLMFGVMHGGGIHFIYTVMSGWLMALIAVWTKSIYAPILQHMAFNCMGAFHNMQVLDEVTNGLLCVVAFGCVVGGMVYLYFILEQKKDRTLQKKNEDII